MSVHSTYRPTLVEISQPVAPIQNRKEGERIYVDALVGGRECHMLVDTGAAISVTNLPLPLTNKRIHIIGVGGERIPAYLSETTLVEINHKYIPMQFYVCQNNEGTIMGNDLMREYQVLIDCGKGKLIWPQPNSSQDIGSRSHPPMGDANSS